MKYIEDYYVTSVAAFYDEKNARSIDYGAQIASAKLAKENAKEAKEGAPGIHLMKTTKGDKMTASPVQVKVGNNETGTAFTMPRDDKGRPKVKINYDGKELFVDALYKTEEDEIYFSGHALVGKESGKPAGELWDFNAGKFSEEIVQRKIDGGFAEPEVNQIAAYFSEAGITNANALKTYLDQVEVQEMGGGPAAPTSEAEAKKKAQELIEKYKK